MIGRLLHDAAAVSPALLGAAIAGAAFAVVDRLLDVWLTDDCLDQHAAARAARRAARDARIAARHAAAAAARARLEAVRR